MTITIPLAEHARIAEELARRNDELAAIDAIGRLAARSPELSDFLEEATRIVEATTRSASQAVFAVDEGEHYLDLVHQRGTPAELLPAIQRVPIEPPAVFAMAQSSADVVSAAIYSPRFRAVFEASGIPTLARVPLVVGSRIIGILAVGFQDPDPEPARRHLQFLRAAGAVVGAVIRSDRLLGSLRQRVSDLTALQAELERAQEQLLQRERLAALGALSAAVAHEVRNPLGVVFNAVGMLRRHRTLDEQGRALVEMLGEEAERLNRIVTDLLGFARPPRPALKYEPLGRVVEEAVRAALAGSEARIETTFELSPDLPAVAVDAGLVRQAVINVALNAVQAMARGGRLRVRTTAAGGQALVEVIDTGPGIPDVLRERVFDPFFTTKTRGTGLGLAIVKHVVEVHGGGVDVGTAPGGGARLALRFPLAPPSTPPAPR